MPPKSDVDAWPSDAVLPLQEWLKLLSLRGVDMRVAMNLAAKAYTAYNTKDKLVELSGTKLASLIADKDQRKTVSNALKGIASGQTQTKKRGRDSDLLRPLQSDIAAEVPTSFDFHEILDPESLIPVTVTVNRAPIKTAWAYTVARRLGFDAEESLSIAHVYVHLSSLKHALFLGNVLNEAESRDAIEEIREMPGEFGYRRETRDDRRKGKGRDGRDIQQVEPVSAQPWVGILKAKIPVIERQDGTWRAIQKGAAVEPSTAYLYVTRALKGFAPHVLGAMKLVAESYTAKELEAIGLDLYSDFKPDVIEWGQRGTLAVSRILDQLKCQVGSLDQAGDLDTHTHLSEDGEAPKRSTKPVFTAEANTADGADQWQRGEESNERPNKKARAEISVEEYEAMLDAEDAGGFTDADIMNYA